MAKGGPEPAQSGQDTSMDFLWIMGMALGAIILAWYFGKAYINQAIFLVKTYEIYGINFFLNIWAEVAKVVGLQPPSSELNDWLKTIRASAPGSFDFATVAFLSSTVGSYLRYPFAIILFGIASILFFGGASHRFRHIFDTKSLKQSELINWPQIAPVAKIDLVSQKLDDGPWAVALSPMRFCKKNNLIDVEQKGNRYQVTLRRGATYRLLSLQLGPRWHGAETLPIFLKALAAIFAARINEDKKGAEELLDRISSSSISGKFDYSGADELLKKNINSDKVKKIFSFHGYVTTVMASMLVAAREVGVLASSEFIWLKPLDRRMWYMLNSVGRPTAVAEICGAYAHWLAEKKIGLPLMVPMVEEAVNGMELALSEILYVPEE